MGHALGITPLDALYVAIGAAGAYLLVFLLLHFLGIGLLRGSSVADMPLAVMLGAVAGRGALGYTPTLGASVVALLVLVGLHSGVRALARRRGGAPVPSTSSPVLLLAAGVVLPDGLSAAGLSSAEVAAKLRAAGVTDPADVGVGILEASGTISVYPRGAVLDPSLLDGVRGAEALTR
jgi:uncharacterized membrane protein YcaP (DUF421 family)